MIPPRSLLVVEDGEEHLAVAAALFPGARLDHARSGASALALLETARPDLVWLDMRFDRSTEEELLCGPQPGGGLAERRRHQGALILAAFRAAGHRIPVLLAHDFSEEPSRFEQLRARHGPLAWLPSVPTAADVRRALRELAGGG